MKAMNAKCMNGIQIFVCGLLDVDGLRWEDGESRLVFVRYRFMEFNSICVSPCCRKKCFKCFNVSNCYRRELFSERIVSTTLNYEKNENKYILEMY